MEKEKILKILGLFECEYKQNIYSPNRKSRHLVRVGNSIEGFFISRI